MKKLHDFDEVFDTQKVFRLLLTAMANPTRTVELGECADKFHAKDQPLLAIGMTLLDNETHFCAAGDAALESALNALTLAKPSAAETADYVFVKSGEDAAAVIPRAKCGTLRDPHLSATVIVLDHGAPSHELCFTGPGIDGAATKTVTDTALMAILAREQQCYEYPQGIDLMFVTDAGALYALPRLTLREVR